MGFKSWMDSIWYLFELIWVVILCHFHFCECVHTSCAPFLFWKIHADLLNWCLAKHFQGCALAAYPTWIWWVFLVQFEKSYLSNEKHPKEFYPKQIFVFQIIFRQICQIVFILCFSSWQIYVHVFCNVLSYTYSSSTSMWTILWF